MLSALPAEIYHAVTSFFLRLGQALDDFSDVLWRFLEVHIFKVIALMVFMTCVNDVCALNVVMIVILAICLPVPQLRRLMSYLSLIWVSIAVMARMFFQIHSINDDFWYSNCSVSYYWWNWFVCIIIDSSSDASDYSTISNLS